MPTPLPWRTLATDRILDISPWFSVLKDTLQLPSGRVVDDYYRIQAPDYVLVAARREDGAILMERHYKQCLGRVILTSPAGGIDEGETPLQAAQRELLEETGYAAQSWRSLGSFVVDGTRGICSAHLFCAEGLAGQASPVTDDMEEFELAFLTPDEIRQALSSGEIALLPDLAILSLALGEPATEQAQPEQCEVRR